MAGLREMIRNVVSSKNAKKVGEMSDLGMDAMTRRTPLRASPNLSDLRGNTPPTGVRNSGGDGWNKSTPAEARAAQPYLGGGLKGNSQGQKMQSEINENHNPGLASGNLFFESAAESTEAQMQRVRAARPAWEAEQKAAKAAREDAMRQPISGQNDNSAVKAAWRESSKREREIRQAEVAAKKSGVPLNTAIGPYLGPKGNPTPTPASPSSSGFSMLGSAARNAGMGALIGGGMGAANIFGDGSFMDRAMSGAMVGGLTGGVAGVAANKFNAGGETKLGKGTISANRNRGRYTNADGKSTSFKPSNIAAGLTGFMSGGLTDKRHTTINSNGWVNGTDPMYF